MVRGKVGPRSSPSDPGSQVADSAKDQWEASFAYVRSTKHRLSKEEGHRLTPDQLGCYRYALAHFLRTDPDYGRSKSQLRVLWQEAMIAFPGDSGLPPLPIDVATCRQVITHGHRLRLELS